ncbi:MAG: hypothetical protein SOW84_06010 [Candidatus Faecousia sp.]|nr:hypothetical protein [Candidatus Faecousia sp.]
MAHNLRGKHFYKNKTTLAVYLILRGLVIFILIRALLRQEYQSVFFCALSLVLMIMPSVISKHLKIVLPSTLEIIILLFIFAAEILGELNSFYVRVPHWDTMLHTINGFLCAAIGFALVDMMNRNDRFTFQLSPLYLAIVSFCFSMTVGVLWEFFEFSGDYFLGMDMQKDTIVHAIHSVNLDPTLSNTVVHVRDIADVIVVHSDGTREALGLGGYLDIGIIDTMKDLFVNFIGAVVFSIIGFFYVKEKGRGKVAHRFIPRVVFPGEEEKTE